MHYFLSFILYLIREMCFHNRFVNQQKIIFGYNYDYHCIIRLLISQNKYTTNVFGFMYNFFITYFLISCFNVIDFNSRILLLLFYLNLWKFRFKRQVRLRRCLSKLPMSSMEDGVDSLTQEYFSRRINVLGVNKYVPRCTRDRKEPASRETSSYRQMRRT